MHFNGYHSHILVMDDSTDLRALFVELLGGEGYTVSTTDYLTHDLDNVVSVKPDLIIVDHLWLSDESGWAQLQRLRLDARTKAIPIILCTGAARGMLESLSSQLGEMNIQVVLKPFDIDDLLQVVARSVRRPTVSALDRPQFTRYMPEQ